MLIVEDDEVIGRGMDDHLAGAGFDPLVVSARGTEADRIRAHVFLHTRHGVGYKLDAVRRPS